MKIKVNEKFWRYDEFKDKELEVFYFDGYGYLIETGVVNEVKISGVNYNVKEHYLIGREFIKEIIGDTVNKQEIDVNLSFQDRLKQETQSLMVKINNLQDFMRTEGFYVLDRINKDLLYDQLHHMLSYLQVLGKRCELLEVRLDI